MPGSTPLLPSMASVMQHVAAHVSSVQLGVRVMLGVVVAFSVGLALLRAFTIRHEVTAWPFLVIVPGVSWAFPWYARCLTLGCCLPPACFRRPGLSSYTISW